MQLLSEMFLGSDLPAMLALFLCGMIGWFGTKQVNRYVQRRASAKQIQKKLVFSNDASELSLANPTSQLNAKSKSRRRSGRYAKADSKPTSIVEGCEVAECAHDGEDPLQSCTPMALSTADERVEPTTQTVAPPKTTESESSGRVAKLMAKKAERKARKLQAQQEGQPQQAKQLELVASPETLDDACIAADTAHERPTVLNEILQKPALQACEETSHLQVFCEGVQDELVLDKHKGQDSMLAVVCVNSSEEVETHASTTNESSQSEQDSMSVDDSSNCEENLWSCNKLELYSPKLFQHMVSEQDGWMSSFEDLQADSCANGMTQNQAVSAQTFVHFDDSNGSEVHFEPVHVSDGTQLYTDGQQLYAAVCVKVDDLVTDNVGFQHLPTDITFQSLPTEPHLQQLPSDGTFQHDGASFQHLPTGVTFQSLPSEPHLQHLPSDGTFQHLPSDVSSGTAAVDLLLDELAPYALPRISSSGYEYEYFRALPKESSCELAPIDLTSPFQPDIRGPEFKNDAENEAWNMCWDFTPSRWNAN
jgi:hypothetical protein